MPQDNKRETTFTTAAHTDYPTTADALLKTVFDSIVSESSINELSDVDDSDTDFKPKYNPDNLFRYRRSTDTTAEKGLSCYN